jgi:hypothetical protein
MVDDRQGTLDFQQLISNLYLPTTRGHAWQTH